MIKKMAQVNATIYSKSIIPTLNSPSISYCESQRIERNSEILDIEKNSCVPEYEFTSSSSVQPKSYFSDQNESLRYNYGCNNKESNLLFNNFLIEEELDEETGNKLHNLLFHTSKDPKQIEFIKDSIYKFPDPLKPKKLDLDI